MLRTAGFPIDGVLRLQDVRLAEAADRLASVQSGAEAWHERSNFDRLWQEYVAARPATLAELIAQPRFRLALTWQNARVLDSAIEPLLAQIARNGDRTHKWRAREQVVAAYWQRYCTKSESIGFFGPTSWASIEPHGPPLLVSPGPSLVEEATVYLEGWTIDTFARKLARQIDLRPWLAPRRAPHVQVLDGVVALPGGRQEQVDQLTEAILLQADGLTSAADLSGRMIARFSGVSAERVHERLVELCRRTWLIWKFELSPTLRPEEELRALLDRMDTPSGTPARAALNKITRARNAVAQAWMDPAALRSALGQLDQAFVEATGQSGTTRHEGLAYGGRTLAYLECRRDVTVTLGPDLVEAMAPLSLLLDSVRWMLYRVRLALMDHVREVHRSLLTSTPVPNASAVWIACAPLLGGALRTIVEKVLAEVHARWQAILGIPAATSRATFRFDELRAAVSDLFHAPDAGWTDARWCSPDVMVASATPDSLRRGDFHLVLGEIHAAANTFDYRSMVSLHPRPKELTGLLDEDHPLPRLVVALPREARPRLTARSHPAFVRDIDYHLVLMPHIPLPGRGRVCLGADVAVVARRGGLDLVMGDGTRFDVMDMFSGAIKAEVAQVFDLYPPGHRPRVVVDRMTVARERWTLSAREMTFGTVAEEADRFAACRRWLRATHLPRQVFVKSPLETKPFYVDFASPTYVDMLASAARKAAGQDRATTLDIVEMLPTPDETWLTDASGNRYVAEFRFVAFDVRPPGASAASPGG
jgi:hypothetical protein